MPDYNRDGYLIHEICPTCGGTVMPMAWGTFSLKCLKCSSVFDTPRISDKMLIALQDGGKRNTDSLDRYMRA